METKKRKQKKTFTGMQGDGFQIGGGGYLRVRLIHFLERETQLFA